MKIAFYGGETAGYVVLLTLLTQQHDLYCVFPEDEKIKQLVLLFNLSLRDKSTINEDSTINELRSNIDLLICCHARKILSKKLVTTIRCINLHPCLYKYKGKGLRPIRRLIEDNNSRASVASHWMVEEIDAGKTIVEDFITIPSIENKTEAEVYNELYPLYTKILLKTLTNLSSSLTGKLF